jgi:plasmid stabilization system protein ParE
MSLYVLTPLAKADIFNIWSYIADRNKGAAERVEQSIYDACAFVAEAPMRGHSRSDLTHRLLRFWTLTRYPSYSVVYRPDVIPIQVVAVLHGKRDLPRVLRRGSE